jgi:serine/threonine-protein kinase
MLAGRATAVAPSKLAGGYPFFLFAQGLAEYRQGMFDRAIVTMRGPASQVLGPAPRLVLAMALYRSGKAEGARETLSAAIKDFDWNAEKARDQNDWICHILRREAEKLIR